MKQSRRIRILVVDDHPVVRRGISAALTRNEGFEVVAEAEDGEAAIKAAGKLRVEGRDYVMRESDIAHFLVSTK